MSIEADAASGASHDADAINGTSSERRMDGLKGGDAADSHVADARAADSRGSYGTNTPRHASSERDTEEINDAAGHAAFDVPNGAAEISEG